MSILLWKIERAGTTLHTSDARNANINKQSQYIGKQLDK